MFTDAPQKVGFASQVFHPRLTLRTKVGISPLKSAPGLAHLNCPGPNRLHATARIQRTVPTDTFSPLAISPGLLLYGRSLGMLYFAVSTQGR
jgi:hypothetical protein